MWVDDESVRKTCKRFDEPFHAHKLTFSCHRKLPLLAQDLTRNWLVESIRRARQLHQFKLWAYVVMPDHAHFIVSPCSPSYSVSAILQSVKQPVSRRAMNHLRKHAPGWLPQFEVRWSDGRVEHRFWQQGGGYDRNVTQVETLWEMIDYVHANPVRKGLVPVAADWAWSSAGAYIGRSDAILEIDPPPR